MGDYLPPASRHTDRLPRHFHAGLSRSNNAGCTWDGGDCCGAKNYKFCKKCECLDCTYVKKGDTCVADFKHACGAAKFKGDGYCDGQHDCVFLVRATPLLSLPSSPSPPSPLALRACLAFASLFEARPGTPISPEEGNWWSQLCVSECE